jgi:hypothetical protein
MTATTISITVSGDTDNIELFFNNERVPLSGPAGVFPAPAPPTAPPGGSGDEDGGDDDILKVLTFMFGPSRKVRGAIAPLFAYQETVRFSEILDALRRAGHVEPEKAWGGMRSSVNKTYERLMDRPLIRGDKTRDYRVGQPERAALRTILDARR